MMRNGPVRDCRENLGCDLDWLLTVFGRDVVQFPASGFNAGEGPAEPRRNFRLGEGSEVHTSQVVGNVAETGTSLTVTGDGQGA